MARGTLVQDRAPDVTARGNELRLNSPSSCLMSDVRQLDWKAFSARFFPERRRHDLEAVRPTGRTGRGSRSAAGSPGAAEEVWEGEGGR